MKGKIKIADSEANVFELLVYDILTGGNSIFHLLSEEKKRKDELQALFNVCHKNGEIKIHVPFLPNFKCETVI